MEELFKLAEIVVNRAREKGKMIALAESCTGGMVATAITSVPGASYVLDRGFVTYSYESKTELLKVNNNLLERFGAISAECVEEMALGAAQNSHADIVVSVSGVAGPASAATVEPVGLIYFASFDKKGNKLRSEKKQFDGDRHSIRVQSTKYALEILLKMLDEH